MSAFDCVAISELHPNFSHPKVIGVVIAKTDVRSFPDRRNIEIERSTFGFTLKDSPEFFINVAAWGNDGYVTQVANCINVGDCVIIENPLVSNKDPEKGDKFCPTTPSYYRLLITEAHSRVFLCDDMDVLERLLPLLHLPVKENGDYYCLRDILANGQKLDGCVLSILAAVKMIGDLKQFTTSDGRNGQRLEVKLFDNFVGSFPLVCWDKEVIQLVQSFVPGESVIFLADVKITFDNFRNTMMATVTSKSIITVNPDTKEAGLLYLYAKELSESGALDLDEVVEDVDVDSITDVYTVKQLKEKANEHPEVFFGIVFGFISKFNLDLPLSKVVKTRCARCKFEVLEGAQGCSNQLCQGKDQDFTTTTGFDLLLDFTDHTGSLLACILTGPAAEQTLGCTSEEFTRITQHQRTALKWTFLLERCKIYVKITSTSKRKDGIRVVVLGCSLADPGEVNEYIDNLSKH